MRRTDTPLALYGAAETRNGARKIAATDYCGFALDCIHEGTKSDREVSLGGQGKEAPCLPDDRLPPKSISTAILVP